MASRAVINDFIAQRRLAVVGVSRSGGKFGNIAYRELKKKGYRLYPIHPHAKNLEGDRAYPDFKSLPEKVGGVLIVVPPKETETVVRQAAQAGIRRVWMQQGAESEAAVRYCQQNGIAEVHGECIMMFAEPVRFPHSIHRWIWKLFGRLPR